MRESIHPLFLDQCLLSKEINLPGVSIHETFFFGFFFMVHLQHMEGPRPGVQSELQLPAYTTAAATWDLSLVCNLYHSSGQCQILNWVRPGIKPASSWILVGFLITEPQRELPMKLFKHFHILYLISFSQSLQEAGRAGIPCILF